MRVIIHDLENKYNKLLLQKCDRIIVVDGKYSACRGCFNCWTKHPAECFIKDSLHEVSKEIGRADELIIITENYYGMYSPPVKNILDRSIGISTPMSIYRGKEMHHTTRYGMRELLSVYAYGEMTDAERESFLFMIKRNALNLGYKHYSFTYLESIGGLGEI